VFGGFFCVGVVVRLWLVLSWRGAFGVDDVL